MSIQEFIRLMLQTFVDGFHTLLGGLAPFMQWIIYLCAGVPMILIGLAAYFWMIKPARETAELQLTAFGKDTPKIKFQILVYTVLGIVGILFTIWIAPRLGNFALVVAADGMNFTPAPPPINGKVAPLFEIPSVVSPTNELGGQPTPMPIATNSGGVIWTVTDSTGADTRTPQNGICEDNDPKTGSSVPFGTEVTVVGSWSSKNIPGQRLLLSTGVCVHSSALTPK